MKNSNWPKNDLKWFGHASFSFIDENGNRIYYIDPFALPTGRQVLEKADIIFITHAHYDHFSKEDIEKIIKNDTILVATADVLAKIDIENERKVKVEPNKKYAVKGFSFATIPAYNNHPDKLKFHPKANNWVGYIFELNGKKIYHAGDTDFIDEMRHLKRQKRQMQSAPKQQFLCIIEICSRKKQKTPKKSLKLLSKIQRF